MKTALVLLGMASAAYAACPNACSGNGLCESNDMCACYANWQGADCSLRTCMSGIAWITTAKGDLNYDGDTDDLVMYDSDHTYASNSVPYVTTPETGDAGDWERWPGYFASGGKDEGHFYMECSNRGICDRSSGQCNCFPGYTGEACRRTTCPSDCSGHGTCQTVKQLAEDSSFTYQLWDAEKSRACKCDAGYGGIACQERVCPYGDDPLTKANINPEKEQADEIQYVDIYSSVGPMSGRFYLKYTDYNGKVWDTDLIDVAVIPAGISSPDQTAQEMADAAEAALEGLPNDVIGDVDVNVIPCAVSILGQGDTDSVLDQLDYSGAPFATPQAFHCDSEPNIFYIGGDGNQVTEYADGSTLDTFVTTSTSTTCYRHIQTWCTRFEIKFKSQPGNLASLIANTDLVTVGGFTEAQSGTSGIGSTVSDTVALVDETAQTGNKVAWDYYSALATGNKMTCDASSDDGDTCGINTATDAKVINLGGASPDPQFLADGLEIRVLCGSKFIGTYVTTATDDNANSITVTEKLPNCNQNAGFASGDSSTDITVQLATSWVNFADHDITDLVQADESYLLIGLGAGGAGTSAPGQFDGNADDGVTPLVKAVTYPAFTGGSSSTDSSVFFFWDSAADDGKSDTAASLSLYSRGQKESSQCSDRGVCDRTTGLCTCFKGYTGESCSTQNSLSV